MPDYHHQDAASSSLDRRCCSDKNQGDIHSMSLSKANPFQRHAPAFTSNSVGPRLSGRWTGQFLHCHSATTHLHTHAGTSPKHFSSSGLLRGGSMITSTSSSCDYLNSEPGDVQLVTEAWCPIVYYNCLRLPPLPNYTTPLLLYTDLACLIDMVKNGKYVWAVGPNRDCWKLGH